MMELYGKLGGKTDAWIEGHLAEYGRLSDQIATHPELSNQEYETSAALCRALEAIGFSVEHPYAGYATGFNARYEHIVGSSRPVVVGLLAQYDALPEVGHGCGHNMCGPMSNLAAGALKDVLEAGNISGVVRVIGTPAEETTGEKVPMAAAGLFDDCSFVMMAHPTTASSFVWFNSLAADPYEFTFMGKAAHAAAAPWDGVNALNGLQLFFHAVDMLRQHVRPEVRLHGIVVEGGSAPNIVPSRASAHFLLRAPWRNYLNVVKEQVFNCARGAAIATGTTVEWKMFGNAMDNMLRNTIAENTMTHILQDELAEPINSNPTLTGSTDMGAISWRVPTIELQIKVSDKEIPPHTVEFAQAARGPGALSPMAKAAKGLARMGLRVLLDEPFRRTVHEELDQRKKDLL
ncbi:Amidohydrolase [uncultured spirochete]|uniref:Peptidase M20 domain-containing protein 2 n=1 Tax=uncultured spirochete TaxID=156406 RepID=A0A3P3XQP6_9SPIR|nr:Amidohydrolase [uncultured spirochete]